MTAATFTLTGTVEGDTSTSRSVYVVINTDVSNPTDDITYQKARRYTATNGVFSINDLPAWDPLNLPYNASTPQYGFTVSSGGKKWTVPAQATGSTHDVTEFEEPWAAPVPPDARAEALAAAAAAAASAAAAAAVGSTNDTIIAGRVGATGSATRVALNAAFATATAVKDFYISPVSGSDSNAGTIPSQAFATLSAAKTAAGGVKARYHLMDTITISSADSYGNGFTLDVAGSSLIGRGPGLVQVKIATTVTWGLAAQAALCTFEGLEVQSIAGGAVTYGAGVTTTNKTTGSAQSTTFRNMYIQAVGGTMVNGYGVGCDTTGGAIDIAETLFENCQGRGTFSGASFRVGNGTSANILNTVCRDCAAAHGAYGVYTDHSNVIWTGNMGYSSVSDIFIGSTCAGAYSFSELRSEGSNRLLTSTATANTVLLSLRDIYFSADQLNADGQWVQYGMAGVMRLANVKCSTSAALVPVISLTTSGYLVVSAAGIATSTARASAFSYSPTKIFVSVDGYLQLSATGSDLPVAASGPAQQYPPVTAVSPANPTGTVSTTNVMAGLGSSVAFTPQSTGKVKIVATGTCGSSVGPNNVAVSGRYGTGTAPANGVAITGSAFSASITIRPAVASGSGSLQFVLQGVPTLTVGTTYWFDIAFSSGSASATANLNSLSFILEEVS